MAEIDRIGGFDCARSSSACRAKRRELREIGEQRSLFPQERDVREYLNFSLAVGLGWPDHLAAMLARATLYAYIEWVVEPDGRLHSLHQGQTREELRAAVSSEYRLPAAVMVHVAHHLLAHPRKVECAALSSGRVRIVDPGGQCTRVPQSSLPSSKMLRKAKTGLNLHADAFGVGRVARSVRDL